MWINYTSKWKWVFQLQMLTLTVLDIYEYCVLLETYNRNTKTGFQKYYWANLPNNTSSRDPQKTCKEMQDVSWLQGLQCVSFLYCFFFLFHFFIINCNIICILSNSVYAGSCLLHAIKNIIFLSPKVEGYYHKWASKPKAHQKNIRSYFVFVCPLSCREFQSATLHLVPFKCYPAYTFFLLLPSWLTIWSREPTDYQVWSSISLISRPLIFTHDVCSSAS